LLWEGTGVSRGQFPAWTRSKSVSQKGTQLPFKIVVKMAIMICV
jgi:hypothetical protein